MLAHTYTHELGGLSDLLHSEIDPTYTTDKLVLLAGSGGVRTVPRFSLIAEVPSAAPVATAGAVVGTGNGAIGAVTADVGAPEGLYQVLIIEPASNGGTFEVVRPDGQTDGAGTIGVAYNGSLNFTLADGSTDFVAGDRIPVSVDYGTTGAKVVRWDPAGTNGSQTITGISCFDAQAADGEDGEIVALRRGPAVLRREAIAWHDGATSAQKADAYAALEARGLLPRQSG